MQVTGDLIEDNEVPLLEPEVSQELLEEEPKKRIPETENQEEKPTEISNPLSIVGEALVEKTNKNQDQQIDKIENTKVERTDEVEVTNAQDTEEKSMETNEEEMIKDAEEIVLKCQECGRIFKERRRLVDHMADVHCDKQECSLCPEVFSNKKNLKRHINEIHRRHEEESMCSNCGKVMSRKEKLRNHEDKCHAETLWKQSKGVLKFPCQYCDMKFSRKFCAKRHEEKTHVVRTAEGYLLKENCTNNVTEEFICKVCPIPTKFASKRKLKRHSIRKHNGRNDQVKIGNSTRNLSEEEVLSQSYKKANCLDCNDEFSCKENLQCHREEVHNDKEGYKCRICSKKFSKQSVLSLHVKRIHNENMYKCSDCGKMTKRYINHLKHVQNHTSKKSRPKKPISSLSKAQQHVRGKEDVESIRRVLFEAPENVKKIMWNEIIKDCPYYLNKIEENPLTEEEVIELIKDNNLSDRQVVNICTFLRQKWGKQAITQNIAGKLVKRKRILDQFFTDGRLEKTSTLHFTRKNGQGIDRSVTYCHDLPGLIAFKKLVENHLESEEVMNVVGIDDGKNILKIVWNWSLMFKTDKGKDKLMGPKKSIILAAVSKVKESHHNMAVLMELTKLNEVEYVMSMDLKLINITIGICSHSSRYFCSYFLLLLSAPTFFSCRFLILISIFTSPGTPALTENASKMKMETGTKGGTELWETSGNTELSGCKDQETRRETG